MERIEVRHEDGDRFSVGIRGHEIVVDQPETGDAGPSPTELFVAGLASCVAFYAERFCERHGIDPSGLGVECTWAFSKDRPARVASIGLRVQLPGSFPPAKLERLQAVVEHCTVHNSIVHPPRIEIEVGSPAPV